MVGDLGQPLRVFHGSRSSFTEFAESGEGIYFAQSPATAKFYADTSEHGDAGPNIRPVYLAIKNPLFLSEVEWRRGLTDTGINHYLLGIEGLSELGHDGIIIEPRQSDDPALSSTVFVAFRPDQILSAFDAAAIGAERRPQGNDSPENTSSASYDAFEPKPRRRRSFGR